MPKFLLPNSLVALALVGCSGCPRGDHVPLLSKEEAVALANSAATRAGYDLSKWFEPDAQYEVIAGDCNWTVFYEFRGNKMPGHFSVRVKDRSRATRVHGGI